MEAKGSIERIKEWPQVTKGYISELQMEMKKVTWPNQKQVQATTAVVILTVFGFAAYFAVVDSILTNTITKIYHALTK